MSEEANFIRSTRKAIGVNQTKFGAMLGVSCQSVSDWETARKNPSPQSWQLIELLIAYDETVSKVVGRREWIKLAIDDGVASAFAELLRRGVLHVG